MQKVVKTLFFTLLIVSSASAQQIYLCLGGRITTMDAVTFDTALLCTLTPALDFADIAVTSDGTLYGCINNFVYRVDVSTGQCTEVSDQINGYTVGMVADATGKIYLAGDRLFLFDPAQSVMQELGLLPFSCAGDLTFWNGDLYMSTETAQVLKINLQDPAQSTVYMDLSEASVGLATIWDCTTGETHSFGFGSGNILAIDFEQQATSLATTKKIAGAGATSPWEWQGALTNHRSIDTIYYHPPGCGGLTGGFELVPAPDELGLLEFSLDGQTWQTSGLFENLPAGVYTVQIRGGACLETTTKLVLDEKTAPPIAATVTVPALCGRATGVIQVLPGAAGLSFSVDGGAPQTDNLLTGLLPGWHIVAATDPSGCRSFGSAYVPDSTTYVFLLPTARLEYAGRCKGYPVIVTTTGPTDAIYTWSENGQVLPGETGSELKLLTSRPPGTYSYAVTATDHNGCSAHAKANDIQVLDCAHLPNAFTPNGDGANDTFGFLGDEDGREYSLTVYDRWGQQLFQSSAAQPHWDGKINDQPAPSDVYVFVASITSQDGTRQQWSGDVTLLR